MSSAITSLDFTIIYLAIPHIQTALHASVGDTQWVAAAYAVAYGGFLLLGGRLADAYGARRCFTMGLCLFGLSSVAGGLAPSLPVLITGRVGQGLGAAILFPATLAMLHQHYTRTAAKQRAVSVWAAAGSGGLIAGTVLGGLLTQLTSWRAVMLVNIPLVLATLLAARRAVAGPVGPASPRDAARHGISASSWVGSAAAAIVTASACLLMLRAGSWGLGSQTWAVLVTAATAACAARALAARTGFNLVPARVVAVPDVLAATIRGTVFMGAFGTVYYLLSLDLQTIRGISPLLAGAALIPGSVGGIFGSALANRLLHDHSPRSVSRAAMIAGGVGLAGVAAAVTAPLPVLLLALMIASVAQGVAYTSIFALAGSGVAPADQGVATGLAGTGQQVGSAVGLAVAALCVQATATTSAPQLGVVLTLAIGAAFLLLSGVAGRCGRRLLR
nr:MFS transporter [Nakamurella aerolata]